MHHKLTRLLAIGVLLALAVALPAAAWAQGGPVDARDEVAPAAPPGIGVPMVWNPIPAAPDATLWNNGPFVNAPGGGPGGSDGSVLQNATLGMTVNGFGHQLSLGYRVSDQFTVTQTGGWQIDTIYFYAYQTGSTTTSTINDVRLQIWNGNPMSGGSVVWGDLTTNRLAATTWSNAYRYADNNVGTTRPIMRDTVTVNTVLTPGTYWLDWETGGTLSSGPWAPPITINGVTTTGDGLQYTTAWAPVVDSGTATPQGFPFIINGSLVSPSAVNVAGVQAQSAPSPLWLLGAVCGLALAGALVARRARA